MAQAWDDPKYKEKPVRKRASTSKSTDADLDEKKPLICGNCDKPISTKEKPFCSCSIWDNRKLKEY